MRYLKLQKRWYPVMTTHPVEPIDPKTSRSICDAVGQKLQRDLRLDRLPESSRIEQLLNAIRRQDAVKGRADQA